MTTEQPRPQQQPQQPPVQQPRREPAADPVIHRKSGPTPAEIERGTRVPEQNSGTAPSGYLV
jgi:hypothetical protein